MNTTTTIHFVTNFRGNEEQIYSRRWDTFKRSQICKALEVKRTTLFYYQEKILIPARILDFKQYIDSHPKRLDLYCMCLFAVAQNTLYSTVEAQKTYEGAAQVLFAQRHCYSRECFEYWFDRNITQKVKNNGQTRVA